MKTIILTGSRSNKGQTAKVTGALIEGLGSKPEEFFLAKMTVERCRQCEDNGWGICKTEGKCVIGDDFQMLVEKIRDAQLIVFATPVYFSDLSESLRAFLDRLRRTCMNEAGRSGIEGKRAIGICVAGGGGGGAPECTVSLEKILQRCGFVLADVIPIKRQNLDEKLEILKSIGRNFSKKQ